jgi:hypothetical protein
MTETTTTTIEPKAADRPAGVSKSDPNHDWYSAAVYRAMALRHYGRYMELRRHAEFRGKDLEGHPPLSTQRDDADLYSKAVENFLGESVETADAALALVEFAALICGDHLLNETLRAPSPIGDEMDAYHQLIALSDAGKWLHHHATTEWLERRKLAALREFAAVGKGGAA